MKFYQSTFLATLVCLGLTVSAFGLPDEAASLAVLKKADASLEEKAMACANLAVVGDADAVPALAELLTDEELHDYARDALERIEDPAAGKALLAALKTLKGSLRVGVIISLGDRGEKAAVPALQKIATGKNKVAADAALSSLGSIATDSAVETILAVLKEGDAETRLAAAHAALVAAERIAADGRSPAAIRKAIAAADVPAHVAKSASP